MKRTILPKELIGYIGPEPVFSIFGSEGEGDKGGQIGDGGKPDGKPDDKGKEGDSAPGGLEPYLAKLDDEGRAAVRSELEKARKEAAGYRTRLSSLGDPDRIKTALEKLDEIEAANKTESQKAQEAVAKAEEERDKSRKELWRERVGRKHKLSDVFTAVVQGSTEEEMDQHAQKIAEELGEARKRPGDAVRGPEKPNGSPGAGESEQFDPAKIAEQAIARM